MKKINKMEYFINKKILIFQFYIYLTLILKHFKDTPNPLKSVKSLLEFYSCVDFPCNL